jgi:hypothetical protein
MQVHPPQQAFEASVGAEDIEPGIQLDPRQPAVPILIGLLQPLKRQVGLAKQGMNGGDIA